MHVRNDLPQLGPDMAAAGDWSAPTPAKDALKRDVLYVVNPGQHRYVLADGVEAVPLWAVLPGRSTWCPLAPLPSSPGPDAGARPINSARRT